MWKKRWGSYASIKKAQPGGWALTWSGLQFNQAADSAVSAATATISTAGAIWWAT